MNLSLAVIVTAGDKAHRAERQAALMLRDEIARRTGLDWPIRNAAEPGRPAVVIAHRDRVPERLALPPHALADAPESLALTLEIGPNGYPRLWLVGGSPRASLYAVGRLLRMLKMRSGDATLAYSPGVLAATKPHFPLRGHQLGYRGIPNTYDAWDIPQYRQYLRDLLLFGLNSVELTPTLNPDEEPNAVMPVAPWEMNRKLSSLCDDFDLDCWIWLPTDDGDPADPKQTDKMLDARENLFRSLPRIDHLFVPGGDPGDRPPQVLMPFLERVAERLRAAHPNAGLWVSPQGFDAEQTAWFFRYLSEQKPKWLTGVVHAPWTRNSVQETRRLVPETYRLRRYPDITHTARCQFPVPQWERAFALTLNREPICPRPSQMAHIHNLGMDYAEGAIGYSEGVNDDANKFIWLERLWNPNRPEGKILLDYGRVFFGHDFAERAAQGLMGLEENWRRSHSHLPSPRPTLEIWRELWKSDVLDKRANWRLQQGLHRAVYDAYVTERSKGETLQEADAVTCLHQANELGAEISGRRAKAILEMPYVTHETKCMREELLSLGAALWKSIGMQMSVPLYHADDPERCAVLDALDVPLNNRLWLVAQIEVALKLPTEKERVAALRAAADWDEPGPGGFYDDLGNAAREPHLLRGDWAKDPGFLRGPQDEFGGEGPNYRLSWQTQASTLYGTPLVMRYPHLDKTARYALRVLYNGRFHSKMRLVANDDYEVHAPLAGTQPPTVMEFDLPAGLTVSGELTLRWERAEGRGCQVAEVWLLRRP